MSKRRSRGAGFVRERGGGRQLVVKVDGRQYVRAVETRTKREAEKMLPAFIVEIQTGAVAAAQVAKAKAKDAPTFHGAVADFIERRKWPDDKQATKDAYAASLNRIGKALDPKRVTTITRHDIKDCLLTINAEGTVGTTKLVHSVLGLFFRDLGDREIIDPAKNPVQSFKALKLPPAGKKTKKRGALSAGQLSALLNACGRDDALRLWTSVMAATGMRPGEALALTWGSVDFDRSVIRVEHSVKKGRVRGQGTLGSTKSASSERDVPLGPTIAAVLASVSLERDAVYRGLGLKLEADDCIFAADLIDARKVPRSLSGMRTRFKIVAKEAGLAEVTPHWLRHTAITAALAGTATTPGISMPDAAKIAGHANATQVARVYGHAVQANMTRGIGLADAMLTPLPAADNVLRLPVGNKGS